MKHRLALLLFVCSIIVSSGVFAQDKPEKFVSHWETGSRKSMGTMLNGKEDGEWAYYYENGQLWAKGTYINGVKTGKWNYWYGNGKKKSECYEDNGLCTNYYVNGKKMEEGMMKSAQKDGDWNGWHENAKPMYTGSYNADMKIGEWKFWYDDGKVWKELNMENGLCVSWHKNEKKALEGLMKDGKSEGKWTSWYESGEIRSVEYYTGGVQTGKWEYWYSNGKKWKELNMVDGPSVTFDTAGNRAIEGYMKNRLKHGKWVSRYPTGRMRSEEDFAEGKLVGAAHYWYDTGQIWKVIDSEKDSCWVYFKDGTLSERGLVKDGLYTGKWITYFHSGYVKRKVNFANDTLNGPFEEYYDTTGQIRQQCIFKNGEIEGVGKWWYKNGNLEMQGKSIAGLQDSTWSFYFINGKIRSKGNFKEGKQDRKWEFWYETGEKWMDGLYADGKKHGLWTTWFESGKKHHEGNFVDGKEDGKWVSWYEKGQIRDEGYF
ncbi:MAG: hypothetical protein KKA07_16010, partial [Bacteroidetes bacterium]|nr:hypothetical protein [Bacteroidota bacterium]